MWPPSAWLLAVGVLLGVAGVGGEGLPPPPPEEGNASTDVAALDSALDIGGAGNATSSFGGRTAPPSRAAWACVAAIHALDASLLLRGMHREGYLPENPPSGAP